MRFGLDAARHAFGGEGLVAEIEWRQLLAKQFGKADALTLPAYPALSPVAARR